MYFLVYSLTCVVLFAAVVWAAIWLLRWQLARNAEHAREQFAALRPECERQFFETAAASGKPRGLRWTRCDFHDQVYWARDRTSDQLLALVGVTISFEAVAGGDMEDVEAVGNLRCATAIFAWNGRAWTTAGRAVFNLEPPEVLERYAESLEPLSGG